jgi:shikimate dehydrogenase
MFNAAFIHEGLDDHLYVAVRVVRGELKSFVEHSRLLGFKGFNVTIPHKVTVMGLLDRVDGEAEEVGAVNTVKITDRHLQGYNTDVIAIRDIIPRRWASGSTAAILGVGGAARAASIALRDLGCARQVYVGRRDTTLREMGRFASQRGIDYTLVKFNSKELREKLEPAKIVVNATPVGMLPRTRQCPLPPKIISADKLYFDMVYNPPETLFLKTARRKGGDVIGGLDMLVAQAAEAFKIWIGRRTSSSVMRRAALKGLRGFRR